MRTFSKKKSAKKEEQEDKAIIVCVREIYIDKERETQYNHGNQR